MPNVTNAFFSQLAYSIETELFQRNYSVFICNSGTDADKERDYFRTLIGKCVDGILCISDLNEIPSDILDRGVPIVCIDRRPVVDRVVPWVGNDDRAAAFNATELLIRKAAATSCSFPATTPPTPGSTATKATGRPWKPTASRRMKIIACAAPASTPLPSRPK